MSQPNYELVPKVAIQEQARKIANEVGHPDFRASYGWLQRFSRRKNLNICGENPDRHTPRLLAVTSTNFNDGPKLCDNPN